MRVAIFVAILLMLYGCGEESRSATQSPVVTKNELDSGRYETSGIREIKVFAEEREQKSNLLPITITDGSSFTLKIPATYSGETIFVSVDGVVKEVVVEAGEGETLFIDPPK